MTGPRSTSRRDFVREAAALAAVPVIHSVSPWASGSHRARRMGDVGAGRWPGYADATVIDFLASPGYFNYPADPPLDATMVRNAVDSGITAVNLTVSSGSAWTSWASWWT